MVLAALPQFSHGPTLGFPLGLQPLGLLWSWPVTERLFSAADLSQLLISWVN
jgi:hypothetical protein